MLARQPHGQKYQGQGELRYPYRAPGKGSSYLEEPLIGSSLRWVGLMSAVAKKQKERQERPKLNLNLVTLAGRNARDELGVVIRIADYDHLGC